MPPAQTRPLDACDLVPCPARAGRSWPRRTCDDLRLVGLKLVFLIVTRAASLLGLSRRESWSKDAEILMLRRQLAVAEREHPRAHSRMTWSDLAWLALLAGTLPIGRLAVMRLIATPGSAPGFIQRQGRSLPGPVSATPQIGGSASVPSGPLSSLSELPSADLERNAARRLGGRDWP